MASSRGLVSPVSKWALMAASVRTDVDPHPDRCPKTNFTNGERASYQFWDIHRTKIFNRIEVTNQDSFLAHRLRTFVTGSRSES